MNDFYMTFNMTDKLDMQLFRNSESTEQSYIPTATVQISVP